MPVPPALTQATAAQKMAAWKQLNETPSALGFHRELSSAPCGIATFTKIFTGQSRPLGRS